EVLHPVSLSYFSLPHFSLRLFAKRKMWERKIRIAQAGGKLQKSSTSYSGANTAPINFTFNGVPCARR
ncbi:MAG: hypothetical protein MOB07_27645, partial [Acidobacteria bacterium]|nr:hypothetical protein [Acidobacteriota bacterium]